MFVDGRARLLVHERDIPELARGGKGDPHLGDRFPFRPVQADRALKDGDTTVADNWDAPGAAGSNFLVVAKGGTSGAGKFLAAVIAA